MILHLFRRRTVESEAARGAENAREFLASNPTAAQIARYYGSACECEAFDRDAASQAYNRAAKDVLKPHLRAMRLDKAEPDV